MAKRKKGSFFVKFSIALLCIAAFFSGAYLILDKVVVPNTFGEYGIHSVSELAGMMTTLYSTPNESKLITNGFTKLDTDNGEEKLKEIFPTKVGSTDLDYNAISEGQTKDGATHPLVLEFTDKEIAGIIDKMLELGMLAKKLPNLSYINTIQINILEFTITPKETDGVINPNSADIHAIFKFNTSGIREQMASEMGTSLFLLNLIVPKTMYITLDYSLELESGNWHYDEGKISVNGRSAKQSEILLNLLISFIFPEEDNMNLEKLTLEFGNILQSGLDLLGHSEYKTHGIIVTIE